MEPDEDEEPKEPARPKNVPRGKRCELIIWKSAKPVESILENILIHHIF